MRTVFISIVTALALAACGGDNSSDNSKTKQEVTKTPIAKQTQTEKKVAVKPAPTQAVATQPQRTPLENGKRFYKKCIACHMADGRGVQGSFPSLNAGIDLLAKTAEGRAYLVLVVYNGLSGDLKTERGNFRGVMVRQAGGKKPQDVADLFNYILTEFYTVAEFKAFSAEEVKAITDKHGRVKPNQLIGMRP